MEKPTGRLELHRGLWRAHVQLRVEGSIAHARGPCRKAREEAQEDLAKLSKARAVAKGSPIDVYEAMKCAVAALKAEASADDGCAPAEELPSERMVVQRLACAAAEAMKNGNASAALAAVNQLLAHPASLDEPWLKDGTLLTEAARWSCADVVAALLEHGASVSVARSDGLSPLHLAAMAGRTDIMRELLLWCADATTKDAAGLTPLRKATLLAPRAVLAETRELLLSAGASESPEECGDWARRCLADSSDKAYLRRFRCEDQPPPNGGIPASGV